MVDRLIEEIINDLISADFMVYRFLSQDQIKGNWDTAFLDRAKLKYGVGGFNFS